MRHLGWMVVWLGLSGTSWAQEQVSLNDLAAEAELHFQLATKAYGRRDYSSALEHLLRSNRLAPNPSVVYNIARTYERLGDLNEAWRYYALYAERFPEGSRVDEARASLEALKGEVALVQIVTDPPGAEVFIDREELGSRGVTPLSLALEEGSHQLFLRMPHHDEWQSSFTVEVGEQKRQEIELVPHAGRLELRGSPEGAVVREVSSGQILGELPLSLDRPPGGLDVVVEAAGFHPKRVQLELVADEVTDRTVELDEKRGQVVVESYERNALVRIDGKSQGFAPIVVDLQEGVHEVTVELDGFHTYTETLSLEEGEQQLVRARMRSREEVVAASRVAETSADAPASVSLITQQEIEVFGYQSVYEALEGQRGIIPTDDMSYQTAGMRGFARPGDYGNRMLMTTDGHTMNDNMVGAGAMGADYSSDLIAVDRIELVRGPGSALYGSNALFGVVNMVNRRGPTGGSARVTGAAGGTLRGSLSYGHEKDDRGYRLSAGGLYRQGRDVYFESYDGVDGSDGWSRGSDGGYGATAQGVGWLGDLTLQGFFNTRKQAIGTGAYETVLGDNQSYGIDTRAFFEARFDPRFGDKAQLFVRAYADAYFYRGQFSYEDDYLLNDQFDGVWMGFEARGVFTPLPWMDITVGSEAKFSALSHLYSDDTDEGAFLDERPGQQAYSGYAVLEVRPATWFHATFGGRYDWFTINDLGAFSPRGALVFQPTDKDILKVIAGTAFRAPSLYELYYNDGGVSQVRPEALDPERILTTEIEYTHAFTDVFSVVGSVYYNQLTSLIDTESVSEGVFRYANTGDILRTFGLDYELRRTWREGWMISAQHTFQQTASPGPFTGDRPTNSPAHLVAFKAAFPIEVVEANLATRILYGSPRLTHLGDKTSPYVVWDLTWTGEVPKLPLSYGVGVRNLLDWKVEHPVGLDLSQGAVPRPGRSFFAELEVDF